MNTLIQKVNTSWKIWILHNWKWMLHKKSAELLLLKPCSLFLWEYSFLICRTIFFADVFNYLTWVCRIKYWDKTVTGRVCRIKSWDRRVVTCVCWLGGGGGAWRRCAVSVGVCWVGGEGGAWRRCAMSVCVRGGRVWHPLTHKRVTHARGVCGGVCGCAGCVWCWVFA